MPDTAVGSVRLAVLETKVTQIESDVAEIKRDVKVLVSAQNDARVLQASERAADQAHIQDRRDMGTWVRSVIPWLLLAASLALGVFNFLYENVFTHGG